MVRIIRVHRKPVLLGRRAAAGFSRCLLALPVSQHRAPAWRDGVICEWSHKGGTILSGEGDIIARWFGDRDDQCEDSLSAWVAARCERGTIPLRRANQADILQKLQLYDAAFRIAFGHSIVPADPFTTINTTVN